jgi:acetamidase/formamidase
VTLHTLEPDRGTLHGHFSRDLTPVLTIDSGDTVRVRTLDAGWGLEPPRLDGTKRRQFEPRDAQLDRGHPICGPISVRGAEPGMVLEIETVALEPGLWGWTRACGWQSPLNQALGVADEPEHLLVWEIDGSRGVARDQHGRSVAIRPFLGVIGVAPAEHGVHSTISPRATGGNIDCKELIVGSRLFLPIAVPGALLSIGDGHAAQGDGELSGTAIECPMARAEVTVRVHDRSSLESPIAETDSGTIAFGFGASLDEATYQAVDRMLAIMCSRHGIDRRDALALASVIVDVRVTQMVNGVVGAHAVLPRGALGSVRAGRIGH